MNNGQNIFLKTTKKQKQNHFVASVEQSKAERKKKKLKANLHLKEGKEIK